jgi:phage terminase large subunit GpA-like protein
MTVSEWADAKRWLSAETASEPGKYYTSRAEYQRGMMDAANELGMQEITFMTAARMGKTLVVENILGYFIDYDPSPILLIDPTLAKGKAWSKLNLGPMIRDNPCLQNKVAEAKTRDSKHEILFKTFPGGHIVIGGANSPGSLSSYSMRIVAFDETDEYPPSAGLEGDPIDLGKQRAANFLNRLFIYTSTPTIRELSRIEVSWKESDQRFYHVPCPHCGEFQILVFGPQSQFSHLAKGFLKFDRANLSWACYQCGNCGKDIGERHKMKMIRHGEWVKQRPEVKHHAGFHINRLYSPWTTWLEVADQFLKAEKRREKLKPVINKVFGETFVENQAYEFDGDSLLGRRETYEKVPRGVILLTAGVDTQDNRLEVVIKGWGRGEESWFIDSTIIRGSPAYKATWEMLDAYLFKQFEHENGYRVNFGQLGGLLAVGVDTGGHHTKEAYEYVKARMKKRFFGIKGMGGFGKTFIKQSTNKKIKSPLYLVGVDAGKQLIYDRLLVLRDPKGRPTPGCMHFNQKCEKEYFDQLTSEKAEIRRVRGNPTKIWVLPDGMANEMLDCEVYNLAAYTLLNVSMEKLAPMLEMRMIAFEETRIRTQSDSQEPTESKPTPKPVTRRGKNWVTGY